MAQPSETQRDDTRRKKLVIEYLSALDLTDRAPDFEFLQQVVRCHVATFAFSSVGCRLGDALPLDVEALFDRIVVRRRGGYCFEQNGFLFEVLQELGFSPELYLARVIYNQPIHPGLTHRISIVAHAGRRYVVDVGFGPLGPRQPVLMSEIETDDGVRTFRVAERSPGEFHMQVLKNGEFFSLYRFELARYGQSDCELGHFYSHRHPAAAFVNHLVVARLLDNETRSLRNRDYLVESASGEQARRIDSAKMLERVLVDEFGLGVAEGECKRLYESLDS